MRFRLLEEVNDIAILMSALGETFSLGFSLERRFPTAGLRGRARSSGRTGLRAEFCSENEWRFAGATVKEADGSIAISFLNGGSGEAPLILRAKLGAQTGPSSAPRPATQARSWESPFQGESERERLSERAHQDRDIVYFLQQPETHAFSLYHDYTESHEGADKYLNVVREGSTVSGPSAYILDTGEKLPTKMMTGAELIAAKIDAGDPVTPSTQIVLIPFPPVKKGQSIRLRISETYTAPTSYKLEGNDLIFDRSLGRARNAVVLPAGWYLTASAIPATITQLPDGRIRLDFWNGRPDSVDVMIKARRRAAVATN